NIRRDRLERGAEDSGQAHQGGVAGEVHQRGPFGNYLRDAWTRRQDPHERPGTGHDNPATPLRDGRRVADELDRVAQSLLGPEEDGAAVQWRSIPGRPALAEDRMLPAAEPPFILGPAPREVSPLEAGQSVVHMDRAQLGSPLQGLGK